MKVIFAAIFARWVWENREAIYQKMEEINSQRKSRTNDLYLFQEGGIGDKLSVIRRLQAEGKKNVEQRWKHMMEKAKDY